MPVSRQNNEGIDRGSDIIGPGAGVSRDVGQDGEPGAAVCIIDEAIRGLER
jgi:hypothetical protein